MNWLPAAKIIYLVIASTLSAHHDLDSACARKEGRVLKVVTRPSSGIYAINCSTPGCATPPDTIEVTEVKCVLVEEKRTEMQTVEVIPEHWEEAPKGE